MSTQNIQTGEQRTALRAKISRSVTDLIRFLRERHNEPFHIAIEVVPTDFRERQWQMLSEEFNIEEIFLQSLMEKEPSTWRSFLYYLGDLANEGLLDDCDLRAMV